MLVAKAHTEHVQRILLDRAVDNRGNEVAARCMASSFQAAQVPDGWGHTEA